MCPFHPTLSRTLRPHLSSRHFPSRRLNSRPMDKDRRRPLKILWGRGNCLWILWISQKSSKPHSRQDQIPFIGWCHLRPPVSSIIRITGEGTWATLWIWIIIRVLPKPPRSRGPAEISKGFLITLTKAGSMMKKLQQCRVANPCRSILSILPQLTRTPNSLPTSLLKR